MERERFKVLDELEIEVAHRVEFRATKKGGVLEWSARDIERARCAYQIPDQAALIAVERRVVFTWAEPLTETASRGVDIAHIIDAPIPVP